MKYVVIGDPDPERFERVRESIENTFRLVVFQAETFEEILAYYKSHAHDLALVLLTEQLPSSPQLKNVLFERYFEQLSVAPLMMGCNAVIGYLYEEVAVTFRRVEPELSVPFPKDEQTLNVFLERLSGKFFARLLPKMTLDDDALLREQVRLLGRDRSLGDGERKLRHMIGGFFSGDVVVFRLRSGLSGAKVFRVRLRQADHEREYLVKLSDADWKLKVEAERHEKVAAGIPGIREYKPMLVEPSSLAQAEGYVVSSSGWHGLCYEFLGGGPFGPSIDLQAALVATAEEMRVITAGAALTFGFESRSDIKTFRFHMLGMLLDWLKREWCTKEGLARRELGRLETPWTTADAKLREYVPFPPYCLSGQTKGCILGFLDGSHAAIGRRLVSDWDTLAAVLERFTKCTDQDYSAPKLDEAISMVRSPAHGDLNANNVLFCPHLPDPVFLIDFPMYQELGHALQDFARIETEIKYALMDRQQDSPANELAGLDFTPEQFRLWCELEDHLRGQWRYSRHWTSEGFRDNVDLSLRMVQRVRTTAEEVQGQSFGCVAIPAFADEYLSPVLYHTLRSITYTSLSPFKRLLAVYSAAKLLQQAGFK